MRIRLHFSAVAAPALICVAACGSSSTSGNGVGDDGGPGNVGSSGVGAASHLSGLLFASDTGIKMLHVPYKGTGPAVTDLLGSRIDIMFAPGLVGSGS